tara:strand:+ start:1430 stop:2527 length:1098 start_codon:yes stop_codon:yes gene_type:complete
MRKSALDKYIEAESFGYANSSGGHRLSRNSKNLLEDSREIIAELFNSAPNEIVFTSGGTEADNWTIKSLFDSKKPNNNLVTSNIEHEAVLASAEWISSNGFQTRYAKSDQNGYVTKDEFIKQIDNETKVASLMWGNNETGVIQPIKEISKELKSLNSSTLFHSDVVQGIISDNVDFHRNGIESAAISAHKIGGPKGVGAMFINNKFKIPNFLHGGKQELERRAGTVDVPGIAAFATALQEQQTRFDEEVGLMNSERLIFEDKLKNSLSVQIIGESMNRLPHISNIQFKDINSEVLLIQLDLNGLGVSRGSACASGAQKPSHVLQAMNIDSKFINNHLRFSFGWTTQAGDGSKAADIVIKAVKEIE